MLRTGEIFAGYVVKRVLGQGGMGTVYLAQHPRLPRMTALKLLDRELYSDLEIRGRFEREADLVAQLDHPNIVTVYDRGAEDEQLWISMQFVPGSDAASADVDVLAAGRAVQIIAETAAALDFAHANGVLHRDVKPANILLAKAPIGQPERVLLTDFGIAGMRNADTTLTSAGTITATLAYAAPEQLSGQPLDHRADQYSLACTLFWMLTGNVPFPGVTPAAVMNGHIAAPVPSLSRSRRGLPAALDAVMARALAKRPADRFPSCTDFAVAARRALAAGAPAPHRPHSTTGSVPPHTGFATRADAPPPPSHTGFAAPPPPHTGFGPGTRPPHGTGSQTGGPPHAHPGSPTRSSGVPPTGFVPRPEGMPPPGFPPNPHSVPHAGAPTHTGMPGRAAVPPPVANQTGSAPHNGGVHGGTLPMPPSHLAADRTGSTPHDRTHGGTLPMPPSHGAVNRTGSTPHTGTEHGATPPGPPSRHAVDLTRGGMSHGTTGHPHAVPPRTDLSRPTGVPPTRPDAGRPTGLPPTAPLPNVSSPDASSPTGETAWPHSPHNADAQLPPRASRNTGHSASGRSGQVPQQGSADTGRSAQGRNEPVLPRDSRNAGRSASGRSGQVPQQGSADTGRPAQGRNEPVPPRNSRDTGRSASGQNEPVPQQGSADTGRSAQGWNEPVLPRDSRNAGRSASGRSEPVPQQGSTDTSRPAQGRNEPVPPRNSRDTGRSASGQNEPVPQ
ncbi:protein kinase, partial [Nocardia sp. NPDC050793]|uniref:serine/threonine-protein kinase n=1 Tax=Nocardia sp. NPDC050793 TaxID=3155159 RepID=UPI0033C9C7C3